MNLLGRGIVHRLDKETSGVIIIAKNTETHEYLSQQFRERTTDKKYIAVIKGRIKKKRGKNRNIHKKRQDKQEKIYNRQQRR